MRFFRGLETLLPTSMRFDPLLRGIARAIEHPLLSLPFDASERMRMLGVDALPESWLDFVLAICGWPIMPTRPAVAKRAVLKLGVGYWRHSGTFDAAEAYLRALTDVRSRIYTTTGRPLYPSPTLYPAPDLFPEDGLSRWRFIVEVPVGSIEEGELRRLLEPVVPAFSLYTVRYV